MKKLISLIIPVYNEGLNIDHFYSEVNLTIKKLSDNYNFELIFTDNNSTDDSFKILKNIYNADPRVRVFKFSKNFGYQKSILAGYLKANGDALIQLDCDLQDPPQMIIDFIRIWESGFNVVYGIRRTRKENVFINVVRILFYKLINYLSEDPLPPNAGDFRLIDKKVVNFLRIIDDPQPYLRGTIASVGFKQMGIPYDRNERLRGSTKFSIRDLFGLAFDGILNHSIIPLRIATFTGIIVSFLSLIFSIFYIIGKLFYGYDWPAGFTTLTVVMLGGIGLNALFLGIIGEYIGRIYKQLKKQPLVVIDVELDRSENKINL